MTTRELLASAGGGGKIVNKQTFTASGTWTKPADVLDTDLVVVDLWGGGGSGGIQAGTGGNGTGAPGAGGGHNRVKFRAGDLNASESVVVGAGGVARSSVGSTATGLAGGFSSFKGFRAYGGNGGGSSANTLSDLATGGGTLSAGDETSSSGAKLGGAPRILSPRQANSSSTTFTSATILFWLPGEWGGGMTSDYELAAEMRPVHGGAAGWTFNSNMGQGNPDPIWRSSIWGGAAGGGYVGNGITGNSGTQTGGTSQFGGNGGSVTIPPTTTSNVNGGDGSPRGGGGAGAKWGSSGTVISGAGGRGEVVITIYRGI